MKTTPEQYQCRTWLCRAWNHWLNPFGNWPEPLPCPEKRAIQAKESWLPAPLWWWLRNPTTNFCNYWIGIVPREARYEWHTPQENGWTRNKHGNVSWWEKPGRISLPYYRTSVGKWEWYIGWQGRGSFGLAFRRT